MDSFNPVGEVFKQIRYLVSRDKNRFVDDEANIDLDLTYITDRVIAMGFPAEDFSIESVYRNNINDVAALLNKRHKDRYRVYNLTIEGSYNINSFENRVEEMGWADHHAPSLHVLLSILQSIDSWLSSHPENVVAIHCKAGRGRTGAVIAAYLLWNKSIADPEEALVYFASLRSSSNEGVSVPSQKRYVNYVSQVLKGIAPFPAKALMLSKILMRPVPSLTFNDTCIPSIEIVDSASPSYKVIYRTPVTELKEFSKNDFCAILEPNVQVCGDILIRFYHQVSVNVKEISTNFPMCRVQFYTNFVENFFLDLPLSMIDSPSQGNLKDKRKEDFPSACRQIEADAVGITAADTLNLVADNKTAV